MGEHDAPVSWLERWRAQEPLRLYLWSVAAAVLLGGVSTGVLTETWALAIGAVVAAVLMTGGTALARRQAFAPATVDRLLGEQDVRVEGWLEDQHALSYRQGVQDTVQHLARHPEQRPAELDTEEMELPEPRTVAIRAQAPKTAPQGLTLPPRGCPFMTEDGRRCVLRQHPRTVEHRLEEGAPAE
jgi:hypothetical protein